MSQLWVTRWEKEGKWRVTNAFNISREGVVSPAKWAPRPLGKDEHNPANFQRESGDELNHQAAWRSTRWARPSPGGKSYPIVIRNLGACNAQRGQEKAQDQLHWQGCSRWQGRGTGLSQPPEICRGTRSQSRDHHRDARCGDGGPVLVAQWALDGFQGVRAQETMWSPGGAPGSDEVGSAPVSPGLCAWCPWYTSYLESKFQTWFEICTVKKGNLGWKRNNQLP